MCKILPWWRNFAIKENFILEVPSPILSHKLHHSYSPHNRSLLYHFFILVKSMHLTPTRTDCTKFLGLLENLFAWPSILTDASMRAQTSTNSCCFHAAFMPQMGIRETGMRFSFFVYHFNLTLLLNFLNNVSNTSSNKTNLRGEQKWPQSFSRGPVVRARSWGPSREVTILLLFYLY